MAHDRRIALVDLDAFYASVEEIERPELRGKPLLIGGRPEGRGVVAAASYEARKYGCHSAMPMGRALRLCPHAIVLPTRHTLYQRYSKSVMELLCEESLLVQSVSIDEAYVDFTATTGTMAEAEALAHRVQGRIRVDLALPCSIGLASNKMVAKVACETGKPSGFVTVPLGQEATFLAGLEVSALPGIGPKSTERLHAAGLHTLGEVASAPTARLTSVLGSWGAVLQHRAAGVDDSPVSTERGSKSISSEETFATDVDDREFLITEISRQVNRLTDSLEQKNLVARTVVLKLRYANFTTVTRSASHSTATSDTEIILATALQLLDSNWPPGIPIRLIGVGVSKMRPRQAKGQLAMDVLEPSEA